jgi:hypothetical protein
MAMPGSVTTPPIPLGDGTYVGEIRSFASEQPPAAGWLECKGQVLLTTNHGQLFKVIANAFGSGQPGTFKLPDLRGAFVRGWNDGKQAIEQGPFDPDANARMEFSGGPGYPANQYDHVGTFQTDQLQTHKHIDSGHTHLIPHFTYAQLCGGGGGFGLLMNKEPGTFTDTGCANLGPPADYGPTVRYGSETRASNISMLFCIRDPDWNKP